MHLQQPKTPAEYDLLGLTALRVTLDEASALGWTVTTNIWDDHIIDIRLEATSADADAPDGAVLAGMLCALLRDYRIVNVQIHNGGTGYHRRYHLSAHHC